MRQKKEQSPLHKHQHISGSVCQSSLVKRSLKLHYTVCFRERRDRQESTRSCGWVAFTQRMLLLMKPAQPRSRIPTACNPPQAWAYPTSCCGPDTAVSVFYYDFLRLSFSKPTRSSGGPSVPPLPLCLFPEAKHTHAHLHTHMHPLATTSPPQTAVGTAKNRNQKWASLHTPGQPSSEQKGERALGKRGNPQISAKQDSVVQEQTFLFCSHFLLKLFLTNKQES